ncbi:phosphoglycolate phosphatase [Oxalobacteraceae bacterium GrIS 1.11]
MDNTWSDIRHVVFDWNGTLIDDLNLALGSVNQLRAGAGMEAITREQYRAQFRFPIADFYAAIGFDFADTPFAGIVAQYLSLFDGQVRHCPLHPGTEELLSHLTGRGIGVSILSASHREVLTDTIRAKGLFHHLTHIVGLEDGHASGKLAEALILDAKLGLQPQQILYIGDTGHDAEIAQKLGWQARMLLCGHQDETQLGQFPFPRLHDVSALLESFRRAQ